MRDVPDIVKILRNEEINGKLKLNRKIDIILNDEIEDIIDNLWFNQWRFL
jgi:hypothetical protein